MVDVNLVGDRRKEKMDDRLRDRDFRSLFFSFNRRERDFDREGNRLFRKFLLRDRLRFEDYDRFFSRFELFFDRRGRFLLSLRRMDDRFYGRYDDYYMRERYRDEFFFRELYLRNFFDYRGELFDRDRRDFYDFFRGLYFERRDDRYDRFDLYGRDGRDGGRDYFRFGEYLGFVKRLRMEYDGLEDIYSSSSKNIEVLIDCVIVVMNK